MTDHSEDITGREEKDAVPSLRGDMIKGSIWMVGMRWTIRGIGLVSTIILARLLMPEDFGLVAMAMLIVGLLDTLLAFGVDLALIQNPTAKREHYDTAWSIQILQGLFVGAFLVLSAPLAAIYFDEERVTTLMRFIAIGVIAQGFTNIGIVAFRKELDFMREFWFLVSKKLISFIVTITLAFTLRTYWALAIGIVTGQVLTVVLSYWMHHYRPRFSMSALRDIWSFSQWMLVINIGHYASEKSDEFIVGGLASTTQMGLYRVSSELSNLPTTEVLAPISRALFPGYAKLISDLKRLGRAYLNVTGFVATFAVAAGLGIALVAEDLIHVVLGEKWLPAAPLMQWLAVFGLFRAVYGQAGNVMIALGHVRRLAFITWLQIIVLAPLAVFAGLQYGVVGIAAAKTLVAIAFMFVFFSTLAGSGVVRIAQIGRELWRPSVAGGAMVLAIMATRHLTFGVSWADLLTDIILGAITYTATLLILWIAAGRPSGAEEFIIEFVGRRIRHARAREGS